MVFGTKKSDDGFFCAVAAEKSVASAAGAGDDDGVGCAPAAPPGLVVVGWRRGAMVLVMAGSCGCAAVGAERNPRGVPRHKRRHIAAGGSNRVPQWNAWNAARWRLSRPDAAGALARRLQRGAMSAT